LFYDVESPSQELEKDELRVEGNWRSARSSSYVGVSLGDYVRRLALSWPLVAMGTSEGGLVVAKLGSEAPESTQQVVVGIAQEGSHPADIDGEDQDIAMELLHGDYDGRVKNSSANDQFELCVLRWCTHFVLPEYSTLIY